MNSLSWFLYAAEVFDNLRSAAQITLVLSLMVGGLGLFFAPIILDILDSDWRPVLRSAVRWMVIGGIISAVFVIVTPEKKTLYAIAASEYGEQIVKSEIGNDATKALQQWIKRQIEPDKKS